MAELGGVSYAASFRIAAPPVLQWSVAMSGSRAADGRKAGWATTSTEQPSGGVDAAYQIVVEGAGAGRSTGAISLWPGVYAVPAKIHVRADAGGLYGVTLVTAPGGNRCTSIESAEVRVYRGGSLQQTLPLEPTAPEVPEVLQADWHSREQPDRMEIVIRYAGREEVSR